MTSNSGENIAVERLHLAAAARLIAHFGPDDGISIHIPARAPDGEAKPGFPVNPCGLRLDEVVAANRVTVDFGGNIGRNDFRKDINPARFTLHSPGRAVRPEASCVLQTRTVAGLAVSSIQEGILPLNQ